MELIICTVCQEKFNYLQMVIFILLPPILLEFTAWGQCDAIYITFALLAFYFALKHRSKLCFISLGLAFTLKLQFLFLVPMIFVMLFIRDKNGKKYLKWSWVWLAPLMYFINLIPIFFGANLKDLLLIYFLQVGDKVKSANNCFSFEFLINQIFINPNSILQFIISLLLALIGISVTIILLIKVFKANRRSILTQTDIIYYALCFAMIMVYFMPRMHERFFLIAYVLMIIFRLIKPNILNHFLSILLTLSITIAFTDYLIFCVIPHDNINISIEYFFQYLGWIINTSIVVILLMPVFVNKNKYVKIDEKKQVL